MAAPSGSGEEVPAEIRTTGNWSQGKASSGVCRWGSGRTQLIASESSFGQAPRGYWPGRLLATLTWQSLLAGCLCQLLYGISKVLRSWASHLFLGTLLEPYPARMHLFHFPP